MSTITFPERPFARFLRVERHEWDDTGEPVWVVYLRNDAAGEDRELELFATEQEALQFMMSWSPDKDLFGNLLPLPEEDDRF
jgi:hypothetical protein